MIYPDYEQPTSIKQLVYLFAYICIAAVLSELTSQFGTSILKDLVKIGNLMHLSSTVVTSTYVCCDFSDSISDICWVKLHFWPEQTTVR